MFEVDHCGENVLCSRTFRTQLKRLVIAQIGQVAADRFAQLIDAAAGGGHGFGPLQRLAGDQF